MKKKKKRLMERFMSMSGFSVLLSFRDDDNDKHPDFQFTLFARRFKMFLLFYASNGNRKDDSWRLPANQNKNI